MYKSAKEIAKNYVVKQTDEEFVPAETFNEVLRELNTLKANAQASMPPQFKGWATWWFTNGGSLHQLWKAKAYKVIWELASKLPKAAWDEQQVRIDAILLKYGEALEVIRYYADPKLYIALEHKGVVQHCVLPGTDMEGFTSYETLQTIDDTNQHKFSKHFAGRKARGFLKTLGG